MIITPSHPLFNYWLHTPPPDWRSISEKSGEAVNFVMDAETGIFRTATEAELEDYLLGGEYDELNPEGEDV